MKAWFKKKNYIYLFILVVGCVPGRLTLNVSVSGQVVSTISGRIRVDLLYQKKVLDIFRMKNYIYEYILMGVCVYFYTKKVKLMLDIDIYRYQNQYYITVDYFSRIVLKYENSFLSLRTWVGFWVGEIFSSGFGLNLIRTFEFGSGTTRSGLYFKVKCLERTFFKGKLRIHIINQKIIRKSKMILFYYNQCYFYTRICINQSQAIITLSTTNDMIAF